MYVVAKRVVVTLVTTFVIVGGAGFLFLRSGCYDVSATGELGSLKRWVFQTVKRSSIAARARSTELPDLDRQGLWRMGVLRYDAHCATCHGTPGRKPGEMAKALQPEPPWLGGISEKPSEAELKQWYWATTHGIEMSGMPAWGSITSDRVIAAILAAMRRFPEMTREEYERWAGRFGARDSDRPRPSDGSGRGTTRASR